MKHLRHLRCLFSIPLCKVAFVSALLCGFLFLFPGNAPKSQTGDANSVILSLLKQYGREIQRVNAKADTLGIEIDSLEMRTYKLEGLMKEERDTVFFLIGATETQDETNSLSWVPNVSINFFFHGGSRNSLLFKSIESDSNGRFIDTLPIGEGNHMVYEAKKPGFCPLLDSVTVSQNPFLLRILLTQEFPTRWVSVEIKARYKTNWEKGLPDRTLELKWGGKIQRTYETNKYDKRHKLGFIPAVEVPQGNQVVEFQVSHGSAVERDWEPVISSKIPDEWKILIEHPK